MGSFSIWHLLILLGGLATPVIVVRYTSSALARGPYCWRAAGSFVGLIGVQVVQEGTSDLAADIVVAVAHLALWLALVRWVAGRLIDVGQSRWWALLCCIPLVHFIVMLVLCFPRSRQAGLQLPEGDHSMTKTPLVEQLGTLLGLAGMIGYFGMGVVGIAAILAGLEDWLGVHWLIAVIIAIPLAYIPLVGTLLGIAGAVEVWDWQWYWAVLLFFWPIVFTVAGFLVVGSLAGVSALWQSRRGGN